MDHMWIENENESASTHLNAPFVMSSTRNPLPTGTGNKGQIIAIAIPPSPIYTHDPKNHLFKDLAITFNTGRNTSTSLPSLVSSLFDKKLHSDVIILPTSLSQITALIPSTTRIITFNRLQSVYPTANEFIATIAKQSTPTKQSLAKRKRGVSIMGLPDCQMMHVGAVNYVSRLLEARDAVLLDVELIGAKHPGDCLGVRDSKSVKDVQTGHYARTAGMYQFTVLVLDLLE
ncbi:UNVERIFIED_CONTAM: hypothetical protein HDU68_008043, partial [Siphonaria sp. JEL0065]